MSGLVLVVDDNAINLKLLRVLLKAEGFTVACARDAGEALDVIASRVPGVILMDIQMPGMDGLALTRMLKADERTRGCCVIAVTAYAMKGDEEKAREAGCDGYVTKPIDTARLVELVRGHLAARAGAEASLTARITPSDDASDPSLSKAPR